MQIDVGDIAGLIAGVQAGKITQKAANELLRDWGVNDVVGDLGTSLLSLGAGLAVGAMTGSLVDDVFDGLF